MKIEIDPMDAALLVEALTAVVLPPKKAARARNLIRYVQTQARIEAAAINAYVPPGTDAGDRQP